MAMDSCDIRQSHYHNAATFSSDLNGNRLGSQSFLDVKKSYNHPQEKDSIQKQRNHQDRRLLSNIEGPSSTFHNDDLAAAGPAENKTTEPPVHFKKSPKPLRHPHQQHYPSSLRHGKSQHSQQQQRQHKHTSTLTPVLKTSKASPIISMKDAAAAAAANAAANSSPILFPHQYQQYQHSKTSPPVGSATNVTSGAGHLSTMVSNFAKSSGKSGAGRRHSSGGFSRGEAGIYTYGPSATPLAIAAAVQGASSSAAQPSPGPIGSMAAAQLTGRGSGLRRLSTSAITGSLEISHPSSSSAGIPAENQLAGVPQRRRSEPTTSSMHHVQHSPLQMTQRQSSRNSSLTGNSHDRPPSSSASPAGGAPQSSSTSSATPSPGSTPIAEISFLREAADDAAEGMGNMANLSNTDFVIGRNGSSSNNNNNSRHAGRRERDHKSKLEKIYDLLRQNRELKATNRALESKLNEAERNRTTLESYSSFLRGDGKIGVVYGATPVEDMQGGADKISPAGAPGAVGDRGITSTPPNTTAAPSLKSGTSNLWHEATRKAATADAADDILLAATEANPETPDDVMLRAALRRGEDAWRRNSAHGSTGSSQADVTEARQRQMEADLERLRREMAEMRPKLDAAERERERERAKASLLTRQLNASREVFRKAQVSSKEKDQLISTLESQLRDLRASSVTAATSVATDVPLETVQEELSGLPREIDESTTPSVGTQTSSSEMLSLPDDDDDDDDNNEHEENTEEDKQAENDVNDKEDLKSNLTEVLSSSSTSSDPTQLSEERETNALMVTTGCHQAPETPKIDAPKVTLASPSAGQEVASNRSEPSKDKQDDFGANKTKRKDGVIPANSTTKLKTNIVILEGRDKKAEFATSSGQSLTPDVEVAAECDDGADVAAGNTFRDEEEDGIGIGNVVNNGNDLNAVTADNSNKFINNRNNGIETFNSVNLPHTSPSMSSREVARPPEAMTVAVAAATAPTSSLPFSGSYSNYSRSTAPPPVGQNENYQNDSLMMLLRGLADNLEDDSDTNTMEDFTVQIECLLQLHRANMPGF